MNSVNIRTGACLLIFLVCALHISGQQKSEIITDKNAGINGSFESSKNGLPLNWQVYSPKTVPNSKFKVTLDKTEVQEGAQSLHFEVTKCDSTGGWKSPGITSEFMEVGKFEGMRPYRITCWVKTNGAAYRLSAGSVNAESGNMKVLESRKSANEEWRFIMHEVHIAKDQWLRLELNVLSPGHLWIDDIRIEKP